MSQKGEIPSTQKQQSESEDIDTQFEDYQLQQYDHQQELDLQEDYLNRLKIQRKRIEELSQLHQDNEDRLKRQIDKNKYLQEEINRLSTVKEYQSKYSELTNDLEITTQENRLLKEQFSSMKEELFNSNNDKIQTIQKLKNELSLQRNKESSKIQNLEQQLSNKQDQFQALQRQFKNRQKQLQDTISTLKNKIDTLIQENDYSLRSQQRKTQKLQRDIQIKSTCLSDFQNSNENMIKENSQMKEEIFRLSSLLASKELQIKNQLDRYKYKFNTLKKEGKNKEKQLSEIKQNLRRQEKQSNERSSEAESLRIEIKKLIQSQQMERHRYEIDSNKQKQSLQLAINQHLATIQQLISVKNDLLAENKKLLMTIRKKEIQQKQRKALLRTQLKQIDKLQKVIDRIVQ